MEYIYAALILHSLGKEINEANIKKIIEASGVKPDEAKVKALIASLAGVDIEKAIKEAAVTPVAVAKEETPKKEEKKDEAKEEKKKADAAMGLASLFGS